MWRRTNVPVIGPANERNRAIHNISSKGRNGGRSPRCICQLGHYPIGCWGAPLGGDSKTAANFSSSAFAGVSASFRHAERRKPAAAVHVEMIDIVDESEAPACCRQFPPFAPFPPVVFLSHPKGGLQLTRRHGACPLEQGADDRSVGDGPASFHRVSENRGGWRSSSGWCGG